MARQPVSALTFENVKTWYWNSYTYTNSVARNDVYGDGQVEIVAGVNYYDGTRYVDQLCVWNVQQCLWRILELGIGRAIQ
jgi:hypothetical protein